MCPEFSVLIGCYGNFPELSLRCVESVVRLCHDRRGFEVLVGDNVCCLATRRKLRELSDKNLIDLHVESNRNLNKDRMMRLLLDAANTETVLWMDDDSHFVKRGWDSFVHFFLSKAKGFDVAGRTYVHGRSPDYQNFLRKRPWFCGRECPEKVVFATGGFFLARTGFLREHGYPDRGMVKKHDDLLLGDLCVQQGGRLFDAWSHSNLSEYVKISDAGRRGGGESSYGS